MKDNNQFALLIVDDEQDVRNAIRRYFTRRPYRLLTAENGELALDTLSKESISLMLLDFRMPGMNGLDVIKEALQIRPELKVIMLTGTGGVQEAVAAMKLGAVDFFEKSISPEVLRKKVDQIHSMWELTRENRLLRSRRSTDFRFDPLLGESPPMLKLKDMIARIAPTETSILIQGESGSGKELVAQAIHHHSTKNSGVFMPVDCAAINESVTESELFGHSKGSFTGADQTTLGLIRSADKGTLFLDEVAELSLDMQAKLLRTIQERTVRPVGSTKMIPVDIRIVAATNRHLIDAIADGDIRQDLFYRISAVTLYVPPLRERGDDIVLLSRHVVKQLEREGMTPKKFSDEALEVLGGYAWPGNVRELENVIRGAMVFAGSDTIGPADLSTISMSPSEKSAPPSAGAASMSDYEKEAIRKALEQSSGNRRKTAEALGISEATVYRRIKEYNL